MLNNQGQHQAERDIERQDNIYQQKRINAEIIKVREFLASYNLYEAVHKLRFIVVYHCRQITNKNDVIDYELVSTETLENDLTKLEKIEARYLKRRIKYPLQLARKILSSLKNSQPLSYDDYIGLSRMLPQVLADNWQQLDGKKLDALIKGLIYIINHKLIRNGGFDLFSCIHGVNYTLSEDINTLKEECNAYIIANIPQDPRAPLNLGLLKVSELDLIAASTPSLVGLGNLTLKLY